MTRDPLAELPVVDLPEVGVKRAQCLARLGLASVLDILLHAPIRYEDRTHQVPLGKLYPGVTALICGYVVYAEAVQGRRPSIVCRLSDTSGVLTLRFFHYRAALLNRLQPGVRLVCYGEVRTGPYGLEMVHPEYQRVTEAETVENGWLPVYPLTVGIQQPVLRRLVSAALVILRRVATANQLPDGLPEVLRHARQLPSWRATLEALHTPTESSEVEALRIGRHPARQRLCFEEMLAHRLAYRHVRRQLRAAVAPIFAAQPLEAFAALLPFTPTSAQFRVMREIAADLMRPVPMLRLVQGDVGSGKTIVAVYAAWLAAQAGWQSALMVPTEMLAAQHYENLRGWLEPAGITTCLLTGKQSGGNRSASLAALREGHAAVAIGTHAMFQQDVEFTRLGMVIIDEQHRFGVDQRLALRGKGVREQLVPHQLIMTATPIPRTMAMLNYADLDVSVIDEVPPGRVPPVTTVTSNQRRFEVIDRVAAWVAGGGQVYWVCPLVTESEMLQYEAAEQTHAALLQALPNARVGLLHGRMRAVDKQATMYQFKANATDVLVATTVIEVGVDVPNANLMIIENAERLGLAQLHQLRGRVGRGGGQSYCVLLYQAPLSETAKARLSFLRECCDGFALADKDLALRGPGELLGTRQTGQIPFRFADLARDAALVPHVVEAAEELEEHHPECAAVLIHRWVNAYAAHYAEV